MPVSLIDTSTAVSFWLTDTSTAPPVGVNFRSSRTERDPRRRANDYNGLTTLGYQYHTVTHSNGEYAGGEGHCHTIEGM